MVEKGAQPRDSADYKVNDILKTDTKGSPELCFENFFLRISDAEKFAKIDLPNAY